MKIQLGLPEIISSGLLPRRLAWLTLSRVVFLAVALTLVGLFYLRDVYDVGSYTLRVSLATLGVAFALAALGPPQGASRIGSLRRASTRAPGQHVFNEIGNDVNFSLSNQLDRCLAVQFVIRQMKPLPEVAVTEDRADSSHSLERLQ